MFLKEQDQIIARMGAEIAYLEQLCQKFAEENKTLTAKVKKLEDEASAEEQLPLEPKKNGKDVKHVV